MHATPRNRADIFGRATRYEIALSVDGELVDVLAYTTARTRRALLATAQKHGARVIALSGTTDPDAPFSEFSAKRITLGRASVHYTGRTERHAN